VYVVDADAAYGAQSLQITRGGAGTSAQTRLELSYDPPLAGLMPVFVDFWIRPTAWSGNTGQQYQLPATSTAGAQIFIEGHFFAFHHTWLNDGLRLSYFDHLPPPQGTGTWQPAGSVPVPIWSRSSTADPASSKDWVRFTARVDPLTQRADVWLNGTLVLADAPRSFDYMSTAPLMGRPFYIQGSSNGPLGFDEFQATINNPLFGDMDADGLPDAWELAHGLNISLNDRQADADGDTLTNLTEYNLRTSPSNDDTDGDGMPDGWENGWQNQAINPRFARDAHQDPDGDGFTNLEEYAAGTHPLEVSSLEGHPVFFVTAFTPDFFANNPEYVELGTMESPFSTLATALSAAELQGGGTIVLNSYQGNWTLRGTGNTSLYTYGATAPITIRGNGLTIDGSEVDEYYNQVPTYSGLSVWGGTVAVEDLNFVHCLGAEGAAVLAQQYTENPVSLTLRRCHFSMCRASDDGGAVRCHAITSASVEDCFFSSNEAGGYAGSPDSKGGAISAESCTIQILRSRFAWNYASGDGGAVHTNACSGLMENSLFEYNTSSDDGGAAALKAGSTLAVRFCTFSQNVCTVRGAGVYNSSTIAIVLDSCILWGNRLLSGSVVADTQAQGANGVATPWNASHTTAHLQTLAGTGNNSADPLFYSPTYLGLQPTSVMINTGSSACPATDLDGNPRNAPGDRGCYEFADTDGDGMPDSWEAQYYVLNSGSAADRDADADQDGFTNYEEWLARTAPTSTSSRPAGAVLYVDPVSGNDSAAGAFSTPLKTISAAIAKSNNAKQTGATRICLRDGTYAGTGNKNLTTNPAGVVRKFYLKSINGKGRVTIDLQDSGRFLTIENSIWDGSCGLEGLTIRRGKSQYQSGVPNSGDGGAILVKNTSSVSQPFIARCSIVGCEATDKGGALYIAGGSLFLFESQLLANKAQNGGAVAIGALANPHIVYAAFCTAAYNHAVWGGGAIFNAGRLCWKEGAVFNNVASWGGALVHNNHPSYSPAPFNSGLGSAARTAAAFPASPVYFQSQWDGNGLPVLARCRLTANDAWAVEADDPRGGAITMLHGEASFEYLLVENNNAAGQQTNDGGAVWNGGGAPSFLSCVFHGNQTTGSGGGIASDVINFNGEPTVLISCAVCDNLAAADGGALYASELYFGQANPGLQFIAQYCTFSHNLSYAYTVSTASPAGTFAGNYAWMRNCVSYYNRTHTGALAGIAPSTLTQQPYTTNNDFEGPTPVSTLSGPRFAWDHYHLIVPTSVGSDPLPAGSFLCDIDGELSSATAQRGCDQWTVSNTHGIPDWYAKILADLSDGDTVSDSTSDLGTRKLWGASGPSVTEAFNMGLDPTDAPNSVDSDKDGVFDFVEERLGLDRFLWSSAKSADFSDVWGRTDAELAGMGASKDFDEDGVPDSMDAVPANKILTFWKKPIDQYRPFVIGAGTAVAINNNGTVVIRDLPAGPSDFDHHFSVIKTAPLNISNPEILRIEPGREHDAEFLDLDDSGRVLMRIYYYDEPGESGVYIFNSANGSLAPSPDQYAQVFDTALGTVSDRPSDNGVTVGSAVDVYTNHRGWLLIEQVNFNSQLTWFRRIDPAGTSYSNYSFPGTGAFLTGNSSPFGFSWINHMDPATVNSGPVVQSNFKGLMSWTESGWATSPPMMQNTPLGLESGSLKKLNSQGIGLYLTLGSASKIWQNNGQHGISSLIPNDAVTSYNLELADINDHGAIIATSSIAQGAQSVVLLLPLDLDIDSDNTGMAVPPDRNLAEESEEQHGWPPVNGSPAVHPGKLIEVNDGDADNDHIPDFADNQDILTQTPPTGPVFLSQSQAGAFVPAVFSLSQAWASAFPGYKIKFDYQDAPFTWQTNSNAADSVDGFHLTLNNNPLPPGALRLWNKPFHEFRRTARIDEGTTQKGDYIAPGIDYTPSDLGFPAEGHIEHTFYIEALRHSEELADTPVTVTLVHPNLPGGQLALSVKLTAMETGLCAVEKDSDVCRRTNQLTISAPAPKLDPMRNAWLPPDPNGRPLEPTALKLINTQFDPISGNVTGTLAVHLEITDELMDSMATVPTGYVPMLRTTLNGSSIDAKLRSPGMASIANVDWVSLTPQPSYFRNPFPKRVTRSLYFDNVPFVEGNNVVVLEMDGLHQIAGRLTGYFSLSVDPVAATWDVAMPSWEPGGSLLVPYVWRFRGPSQLTTTMTQFLGGTVGELAPAYQMQAQSTRYIARAGKPTLAYYLMPRAEPARPIVMPPPEEISKWEQLAEDAWDYGIARLGGALGIPQFVNEYGKDAWMFKAGVVYGVGSGAGDLVVGIVKLAGNAVEGVGQVVSWGLTKIPLGVGEGIEHGYKWMWDETPGDALKRKWSCIKGAFTGASSLVTAAAEIIWKISQDQADVLLAVYAGDEETMKRVGAEYEGYFIVAALIMEELDQQWETTSEFQKGNFTGRILFEIGSLFTGAGALKGLNYVQKLEKLQDRFRGVNGFLGKVFRICADWIVKLKTTKMCFIAGTLVHTSKGLVPIEEIQPGDLVLSRDEHDPSKQGLKRVVNTFVTNPDVLHHLTWEVRDVAGSPSQTETISASSPHPFFVLNRPQPGFVPAGELQPGDIFSLADSGTATLTANRIEHAAPGQTFITYNFEVADYHTYFVGTASVWVHNAAKAICERVYLVYQTMLKRHSPADPVEAFERTRSRMDSLTKWTDDVKIGTVDSVLADVAKMKNAGTLDQRLIQLGTDPDNNNSFSAAEVFAGRRFEMLKGKQLTRSDLGADFKDQDGVQWDAKGPIPSQYFQWNQVMGSIDSHYLSHWTNKDEKLVYDLAGLTASQKALIKNHLSAIDPNKLLYELLDD